MKKTRIKMRPGDESLLESSLHGKRNLIKITNTTRGLIIEAENPFVFHKISGFVREEDLKKKITELEKKLEAALAE